MNKHNSIFSIKRYRTINSLIVADNLYSTDTVRFLFLIESKVIVI